MQGYQKKINGGNIATVIAAAITVISFFVAPYVIDRHGQYTYQEFCGLSDGDVGNVFLIIGIVSAALAALFAICKINTMAIISSIVLMAANLFVFAAVMSAAAEHSAFNQVETGAYLVTFATVATFIASIVGAVMNSKAKKAYMYGGPQFAQPQQPMPMRQPQMGQPMQPVQPQFAQPQMGQPVQPQFAQPQQPQFGQAPVQPQFGQAPVQPQFGQAPAQPQMGQPMQPAQPFAQPAQPFAQPAQPAVAPDPVVEPSPVVEPMDDDDDEKTTLLQ